MPNRDQTSDAAIASSVSADSSTEALTGARKSYKAPVLQRFGQLNRVTQGSGGTMGDGSSGMTRGGGGMDMNMNMGMGGGMGMN